MKPKIGKKYKIAVQARKVEGWHVNPWEGTGRCSDWIEDDVWRFDDIQPAVSDNQRNNWILCSEQDVVKAL